MMVNGLKKLPKRLAFILLCLPLSCLSDVGESENEKREADLQRTTLCVYGGLPMEIRFSLPHNPPPLDEFTLDAINNVAGTVDKRVAQLLEKSAVNAWQEAKKFKAGSSEFANELESAFAASVVEEAPSMLQLELCGDATSVGGAILAALAEYFSRTASGHGGNLPTWLKDQPESVRARSTSLVMLAVSLSIAKVSFDPRLLMSSYSANAEVY